MHYSNHIIIIIVILVIILLFMNRNRPLETFANCSIAYNDLDTYKLNGIKGYNDLQTHVDYADSKNSNKCFDNSFYKEWQIDENLDKEMAFNRVKQIANSDLHCVNYNNVNQCMSVCSNTDDCTGFYIKESGKCCMLTNPSLANVNKKDRHHQLSNNIHNNLIKHQKDSDSKIIFNKIGSDGFNDVYTTDMNKNECKKLCPKCIMGRCPTNYRCTKLMANPATDHGCIIGNEDRYDENVGHTFDGPNIPYLNDKYAINEHAGFHDLLLDPHTKKNTSERLNIHENIVPSKEDIIKSNTVEHFDQWVNRGECFDPEMASENAHFVAIHGGNDLLNLHGYYKCNRRQHPRNHTTTANDILEQALI